MANNSNSSNNNQEQVVLNVNLNTDGAAQQGKELANDLNNSLNNVGKDFNNTSIKSLKQQLKEAREGAVALQMAGKANTKEYQEFLNTIAGIKDEQDVLNRSVEAFDPGNKYQALSKIASLGASSVAALSGSLTLLGVSSETANESIAKLTSLQSIIGFLDVIGDSGDYITAFLQRMGLMNLAAAENATVTAAATTATIAQGTAITATSVATNVANTAFKALKITLASLGIGAVMLAVGYLVSNWDSLKESVNKFLPAGASVGNLFTKIQNMAIGLGGAIVSYVVTPFKMLQKVLTGDFKGAIAEFKNGVDVVGNYSKAKLQADLKDAKKANLERLQDEVKTVENRLKVLKAAGKNTDTIERELYRRKLILAKDDKEKYQELQIEKQVFEAGLIKKQADATKAASEKRQAAAKAEHDKAVALAKQQNEELKKYTDEARKLINDSTKSALQIELENIDFKYQKEIDLAKKLKSSTIDIEKAKAIEKNAVNKRYADEINAYLKGKDDERLNQFDKQRKAVTDELEKLLANANSEDAARLIASGSKQLSDIDSLENATGLLASTQASTDKAKLNKVGDDDTADTAKKKITDVRTAELNEEVAQFNLKKLQLAGQKSELEALEQSHAARITQINQDASDALIQIGEKEKQAKLDNLSAVSNMAGNAANLFNKHTVAHKALSIAQATIDTYLSAQSAYSAMAKIPVVGPALGIAAAGIAVAGGLKNVKSIMSVKVPNDTSGGGGSVGGGLNFQAPIINSTILKQNDSGMSQLNNTVASKNNEPIQAFIVDKDLSKQKEKEELYNKLSTL